jgi:hypothetical protein
VQSRSLALEEQPDYRGEAPAAVRDRWASRFDIGRSSILRSTFASNALAAGVSVFELARVMGTSVAMIERHYGTLIEGAGADIARRLTAFEAQQERATGEGASGF